jgi:hypothetical protein
MRSRSKAIQAAYNKVPLHLINNAADPMQWNHIRNVVWQPLIAGVKGVKDINSKIQAETVHVYSLAKG